MRWVFAAALVLGGCSGGNDPQTDAGVDPGHLGAHVTWNARRPNMIPGPVSNSVVIRAASFALSEVRLVGDAGTARVEGLMLAWAEGSVPEPYTFLDAPSGLYSRIVFTLATTGATAALEITGTSREGNEDVPFRIVDAQIDGDDLDVAVAFKKVNLPPGGECDIRVKLDFRDLIDRVDFDELPMVDGVRVLDENHPMMNEVRRAVREGLFSDMSDDDD
jgi:hypothetical protein